MNVRALNHGVIFVINGPSWKRSGNHVLIKSGGAVRPEAMRACDKPQSNATYIAEIGRESIKSAEYATYSGGES